MKFLSVLEAVGKGALKIAPIGISMLPGGNALAPAFTAIAQALIPPKFDDGSAPAAPTFAGNLTGTLGQIAQMTFLVERMWKAIGIADGGGAKKLAAVKPFVADIVRESEIVAGHPVADEATFDQGIEQIINGVVDVLKSLHSGIEAPPEVHQEATAPAAAKG